MQGVTGARSAASSASGGARRSAPPLPQPEAAPQVIRWCPAWSEPEEISNALLLETIGVAAAQDADFAFAAYLAHLRTSGERLVLTVDDLTALPEGATHWLRGAVERSGGALRVVASVRDDRAAATAAARLGVPLRVAQLAPPPARGTRTLFAWLALVTLGAGAVGVALAW